MRPGQRTLFFNVSTGKYLYRKKSTNRLGGLQDICHVTHKLFGLGICFSEFPRGCSQVRIQRTCVISLHDDCSWAVALPCALGSRLLFNMRKRIYRAEALQRTSGVGIELQTFRVAEPSGFSAEARSLAEAPT
jgi:hypothetical protein